MSSENIEVVHRIYAALGTGDRDAVTALTQRDFVALPPSPFVTGETRPYRGHADIARWFDGMARRWESFHADPVELRDREDMVLATVEVSLKPRSGATMTRRVHAIWTLEDGRVASVQGFERLADALRVFERDASQNG